MFVSVSAILIDAPYGAGDFILPHTVQNVLPHLEQSIKLTAPLGAVMDPKWKKKSRKLAREMYWEKHDRETYECPDCGRREDELVNRFEVHHIDGQPMDNRPENHIALCRPCHNLREGKKPSKAEIENIRNSIQDNQNRDDVEFSRTLRSNVRSVYLAGTMTYHGKEDSYWNGSVFEGNSTHASWRDVLNNAGPVTINSPKDLHFNHGADLVDGVTGADLELLNESDAIIAYFDKEEQVGTLTELVHAVSHRKPALVLFASDLVRSPKLNSFEEIDASHQWISSPVRMRCVSPIYWFLINYLLGDRVSNWAGVESDVKIGVVDTREAIDEAYREWAGPILESVLSDKQFKRNIK